MEYVRNRCEDIYQEYWQDCQQAYFQAYQQVYQQVPIQENQQVNQQTSAQENQQQCQQAFQRYLQKYMQVNLDKFNKKIRFFESQALIRPDDDHNNPNICRVNEAIGEDYKKWNNIDPVFIDAPTGSGKTSFVYEKLIPDAISKGCGVLIVSNRIALSRQQKLEVYDIVTNPKYKHFLGDYNLEDLKREEIDNETYMIGPVCVVTYQSLYRLFNPDVSAEMALGFYSLKLSNAEELQKWSRSIKYAVFDEIHILYADAEFNSFCSGFLRSIPFVFRDVVRVYMTATSYEVIDYIRKYEICKYSMNVQNPPKAQFMDQSYMRSFNWIEQGQNVRVPVFTNLIRYTINPDYSRYELVFFNSQRNKNSSGQDEASTGNKAAAAINVLMGINPSESNKVIVFVDSKTVGAQICRRLRSDKVTAAFLTKDSSDPKTVRDNIIINARFDESVLITTQVLDSGVNICDESVKNIMIFYTDRTQFIQSLGRRRLEKCGDSVTVWAYVPSAYSFRVIADEYSAIVETYEKVFPERVDSKRSEKSKDEMGAKSLNKWLEELGSEYTLNVNYNDANDRSIEKRIWRIEKKDNMPAGSEG